MMNTRLIIRAVILSSAISLLAACSLRGGNVAPEQLDIEVKNSTKTYIDPDLERESRAMHHYLLGQLLYNQEEFSKALENFESASKLSDNADPALHTRLAELLVRSGELEKALEECRRTLEANPEDTATMLLYAGILEALKRDDEAEPVYRKLIQSKPDSIDAYVLLASLYIKAQNPDKGIALLKDLIQKNPKEPLGHAYLARAMEIKGNLNEAEKHMLLATELNNDNVALMIDLLRIYLKQKKIEKAKDLCARVLEKDPNNVQARKVLGQLLIGENRYDEALSHLHVLETLEQDSTDTRFKIALIQIGKQRYKEAITELNLVLAANPNYSEARYYLASVYTAVGRKNEAIDELLKVTKDQEMFVQARTFAAFLLKQEKRSLEAEKIFKEAYEAKPGDANMLSYLVLLMRENKHFSDAQELLEDALDENKDDDKLLFSYASLLYEQGKKEEALAQMEKIVAQNPKHSDALNFIAYHLAESGNDLDRALDLVNQALAVRANDGYYLDTLGWIYYQQRKYQSAVESLSRAVALVPDDAVILTHYADALFQTNDRAGALKNYQEAATKLEQPLNGEEKELKVRLDKQIAELSGELEKK